MNADSSIRSPFSRPPTSPRGKSALRSTASLSSVISHSQAPAGEPFKVTLSEPSHSGRIHRDTTTMATQRSVLPSKVLGFRVSEQWYLKNRRTVGNVYWTGRLFGSYFILSLIAINVLSLALNVGGSSLSKPVDRLVISEILLDCVLFAPLLLLVFFAAHVWSLNDFWRVKHDLVADTLLCGLVWFADVALTTRLSVKLRSDEDGRWWRGILLTKLMLNWTWLSCSSVLNISMLILRYDGELLAGTLDRWRIARKSHSGLIGGGNQIVPLAFLLCDARGSEVFARHCEAECSVEHYLFLAHVCHLKFIILQRLNEKYFRKTGNFGYRTLSTVNGLQPPTHPSPAKPQNLSFDSDKMIANLVRHRDSMKVFDSSALGDDPDNSGTPERTAVLSDRELSVEHLGVLDEREKVPDSENPAHNGDDPPSSSTNPGRITSNVLNLTVSQSLSLLVFRFKHQLSSLHSDARLSPIAVISHQIYDIFIRTERAMEINIGFNTRANLISFFSRKILPALPERDLSSRDHTPSLGQSPPPPMQSAITSGPAGSPRPKSPSKRKKRSNRKGSVRSGNDHIYLLYHIFDAAWTEVWTMLNRNVYPRFRETSEYREMSPDLWMRFREQSSEIDEVVNGESSAWFDQYLWRDLVSIQSDPMAIDEQISVLGTPMVDVKQAMV